MIDGTEVATLSLNEGHMLFRHTKIGSITMLLCLAACARPPKTTDGAGGGGSGQGAATSNSSSSSGTPPVVGCDGDGSAAQPFGNHEMDYVEDSLLPSHGSLGELDQAVRNFYDAWKSSYLAAGCGDGRYYVKVEIDESMTVSEAHGYGMVISAYLAGYDSDAQVIFDGLYRFFADHPSAGSSDLMAWSQDYGCDSNQGEYSATDGDLDIAYALLLADKQWGSNGAID